ncbi:PQQ-dependent sugar dehydrogenase [Methanotrichaceae archaeon M04Ac]|uniref:PQQ-dependent sugar dehydrogenase n=1 Tax=Candidatus Methanocrinis alkalitolerans TaxID=3033395 RepID=A0ABT5XFX3_9EURY|nr:PQQ-dependent sugar dehydrogenase [Candidatus Methanocrinis alkalitolerans]MDF0593560.1 PQQ-dependent sugar dehydrogenase [Candidatus Methanocrinis alkalitolerans]
MTLQPRKLLVPALLFLFALVYLNAPQGGGRDLPIDLIELPPGFEIEVYAADVPGARSLALGAEGTVFVGTRSQGRVYAIRDEDGNGRIDPGEVFVIAEGLDLPNGVAFRDGSLYVAEVSRILRFDGIEARLGDPPVPIVVKDDLPRERSHGWRFIAFGPDGKLYVAIGAPCNVCDPGDPYATITRMDPDGGNFEIFARGVRNTVGFDWHPGTGELWFTDNGRDWMGDDLPPDELNRAAVAGLHFGFPFCHAGVPDPAFGASRGCGEFVSPEMKLGPHVAALGMRFYSGTAFPPERRGAIFIAEHGSWNRADPIGYRVTTVSLEDGRAAGYDVFAEGWLQGREAWGRPVDLMVMDDGSLLVSDDFAGAIYRILHVGV